MFVIAMVLLLTGVAGGHFVRRRRFYRRNAHGVEVFRSYSHSVFARGLEALVLTASMILMIIGTALMVVWVMR